MPGRAANPLTPIDLLNTARGRVDRELAGQPDVRLELLAIIGESFYGLRDNAAAAEVLEQALRAAQAAPGPDAGMVLHLRRLLAQAYAFSAAMQIPAVNYSSSSMRTSVAVAHPIQT